MSKPTCASLAQSRPVLVLGAGMVGVSVAIHLQQRGRQVVLVDRKAPGQETSFGNAGLIQREAVYPYAFPRAPRDIVRLASNRSTDVRYEASALPGLARFLWAYWRHSAPTKHAAAARHYATLIEHCVSEHRQLVSESGPDARMSDKGWIKVFRDPRDLAAQLREADALKRDFGVEFDALDSAQLTGMEPSLRGRLAGGLHYTTADSTPDPGMLVTAYFRRFLASGGKFVSADATTLAASGDQWRIDTPEGTLQGPAVIALGPWSGAVVRKLGYPMNLGVKRGYHMHYRASESVSAAVLNRPVLDADYGYVLAPMTAGIRLTTGVEMAEFDAPPTTVQLDRAEPVARSIFPLGDRADSKAWMGRRPCTPDMLPVIGAAPRHKDLWFAFGHGHQGLTLGPITGRVLAELITGQKPFVDPAPFSAARKSLY